MLIMIFMPEGLFAGMVRAARHWWAGQAVARRETQVKEAVS
jgi:hypothetical protein